MITDQTSLHNKVQTVKELLDTLGKAKDYSEKVHILDALPIVSDYLDHPGPIQSFMRMLTPESQYALKVIIAIGQAPIVFNIQNLDEIYFKRLVTLLEQLLDLEVFYAHLGGIIGYYYTMINLISKHQDPPSHSLEQVRYIHPEGIHLEENSPLVNQAVRWGIENVEHVAAIFPVGGAGDRLNLRDERTQEGLPAALLPFLGRTLLDGLMRDLQAQEYLAFRLKGKQPVTPVAIMTSIEKNNHIHILDICKKAQWYGRRSEDFHFFIQPLVPVITSNGDWSLSSPLSLTLKPCGHGALWKLAEETHVFDWLESRGRHHCYVRQINNPLGAIDQGLLALIGVGCAEKKAFGFLSCERVLNSDEGTNVLIEKKGKTGYAYTLTNIEYTEFAQKGIDEIPAKPGSKYSIYPANTNILFADIPKIRKAIEQCPIPGQLINMKSKVPLLDASGHLSYVQGGRLESTMQNIADELITHSTQPLKKEEYGSALQSFILSNSRSKTISPTKKSYIKGESTTATPEQAFYDLLACNYALLEQCGYRLPQWKEIEHVLAEGPSCIFIFHPGLGPLFSIIKQKMRQGSLSQGSELQLEIAEVDIEDLSLEGSLLIEAKSPLGSYKGGQLQFGNESRCVLKRVVIRNQGIDHSATHHYWKNEIVRKEDLKIILHEGAEFHAEDIVLTGSHTFEVPAHCRLTLTAGPNNGWKGELVPITQATWQWNYTFDSDDTVRLEKK